MGNILKGLLTVPKDIQSRRIKRNKTFIETSVSGKTIELARKKAELEKEEGWEVLRENISSIKLKKAKPHDELLEDRVWCFLAEMGFKEMSEDRNFSIPEHDDLPPRQIDVFAKDDETVVIVECTGSEQRKEKSLSPLIQKILSYQNELRGMINKHYGTKPKLKICFGIATQNIAWRKCDEDKCLLHKIFILKDHDIEYYTQLTKNIKLSARFQFLGHVLKDNQVQGLNLQLPATQSRIGKDKFYHFMIHPEDLLKISYISHRRGSTHNDFDTYQRMLKPARLKSIGAYIDNGGQFPTNIVINMKSKRGVTFEKKETIGDITYGTLHLPSVYASAWVIDGQHRLYGYAHSERAKDGERPRVAFPVLAYDNLSLDKEVQLFVDINTEQVKVSKNLLSEIYANLKWQSDDPKERDQALRSRLSSLLGTLPESPIFDRVLFQNQKTDDVKCITLTTLMDGLKENYFLGDSRRGVFSLGPLYAEYSDDPEDTVKKAFAAVCHYLSLFKAALSDHWAVGKGQGGFLATNNGLRALFAVYAEILSHIESEHGHKLSKMRVSEFQSHVEELVAPLTSFLNTLTEDEFAIYRASQAKAGVNKNASLMMRAINSEYEYFAPQKLKEFNATVDIEGTKEASLLISEIERWLLELILVTLKSNFNDSEDSWWFEGVPDKNRRKCQDEREKDKGKHDAYQYLKLVDYFSIILYKWSLFKAVLSLRGKGTKSEQSEWLNELEKVRQVTTSTGKWPAKKTQVVFVREIHKQLKERLGK